MKDTWRLLPKADVLYGCDEHWWEHHIEKINDECTAELWTQCPIAQSRYNLNRIEGESKTGLGKKKLHFGGNSGYQAVNLAFLFGATKIILVGFDMQRTNDKIHFFGAHPYHRNGGGPTAQLLKKWCENFSVMAQDLSQENVEVINASKNSALTCFEKKELELC